MRRFEWLILPYFWLTFFLLTNRRICLAQKDDQHQLNNYSTLNPAQQRALDLLAKIDTVAKPPLWPHIQPALFFANIRKNILYPAKINQGQNTNFCSYAALTHLLIRYQPDNYTEMILALYKTGQISLYSKRVIKASQRVRNGAGLLSDNGELNLLHADQLWFLTMADNFRGYLNLFDHKYKIGDENTLWAATNYKKFNRMVREFGGYKVHAIGADLLRPWKKKGNLYKYMVNQLDTGLVMMYINGKLMYPHKFTPFTLPSPTHFVVLYELKEINKMIKIKYWDYGLKTEQLITWKRFKKTIYGVSSITGR